MHNLESNAKIGDLRFGGFKDIFVGLSLSLTANMSNPIHHMRGKRGKNVS